MTAAIAEPSRVPLHLAAAATVLMPTAWWFDAVYWAGSIVVCAVAAGLIVAAASWMFPRTQAAKSRGNFVVALWVATALTLAGSLPNRPAEKAVHSPAGTAPSGAYGPNDRLAEPGQTLPVELKK